MSEPAGDEGASPQFKIDWRRHERLGFGEAVFCAGKTPAQIAAVLDAAREREAPLLLTRLDAERHAALPATHRDALDYEALSGTAFAGSVPDPNGAARVVVVTAGTSDTPVSREAIRTLAFEGVACLEINDVGVAGIWRLFDRIDEIREFPCVIAAAGMDAALPSVLAGLVAAPIVAVPTSVGYGVAAGGLTALNAILASCAPGLMVVNVDNGYGAACAALRVLGAASVVTTS